MFFSAPILADFDPDFQTKVETDSSNFAKTRVLSQLNPVTNKWHLVAFYSKEMSPAEINYDIHDKELRAIVSCFKEWSHLLRSCKDTVTVYTDHQNLTYFDSKKVLKPRQARWAANLTEFDFKVIYQPGRLNAKADTLSHYWDVALGEGNAESSPTEIRLFKPRQLIIAELKPSINSVWSRSIQR